mmetsp:Transcript_3117/g.3459  ORF Transcript_3117/g.3459 Transcript_3117/m.3459 type:complete len:358 (-) Transcript_3117:77-1150(-)
MACCGSSDAPTTSTPAARKRSKQIDEALKLVKKEQAREIKILILGTGSSGKSTFAKQMKLVFCGGWNETEISKFQFILRNNALTSMQWLLFVAKERNMELEEENKELGRVIYDADKLTKDIAKSIETCWKDSTIKDVWKFRNEIPELSCQADFYIKNAVKFAADDFTPTNEDILKATFRTTGIVELQFPIGKLDFNLVDVGGQRAERRKWLHCFGDVTAVIFIGAIDAFDQVLEEHATTNRMLESIQLFGETSNSSWFRDKFILLMLNKADLLKKKLKSSPKRSAKAIKAIFKDFDVEPTFEEVSKFITTKYMAKTKHVNVHTKIGCAIDTENMKAVFRYTRKLLLDKDLEETGLPL